MHRWPVERLERPRRALEDRLALGAPWLTRRLATRALRLPAGGYDVLLSMYHADAVVETAVDDPGGVLVDLERAYHGHDGIGRLVDDWKAPFGEFRFLPREIVDPGGDRFATHVEHAARGMSSGLDVDLSQWIVYQAENGLRTRQCVFWEESSALKALHSPP